MQDKKYYIEIVEAFIAEYFPSSSGVMLTGVSSPSILTSTVTLMSLSSLNGTIRCSSSHMNTGGLKFR